MVDAVGTVEVEITGNLEQFEQALVRARQLAGGLVNAQNSGLRNFSNDATKAAVATRALAAENITLRNVFRDVAGSLAVLQGPLGPIAGRFGFLGTMIGRAGVGIAGFGVAVAGLVLSANEAIDAFADEEKQLLTLNAVLRATAGAAGQTMQSLNELEQSISTTTMATDDQVRSAETLLLTFRSISGTEFPRTLKAAQDLAATGFGSIEGNVRQLGRALEDPIRGLDALRRSGVTFSASQREVIKNLVETGQQASAQREVLKAIEIQVGGAGAAQASGTSGAFHQLSEAVNNVTVAFGEWISKTLRIPEAARAAAAGLNAMVDSGDKLSYSIFGVTVEFERYVTGAEKAKEASEALTKQKLAEAATLDKVAEIEGRISRGDFGGTPGLMTPSDAELQKQKDAAVNAEHLATAMRMANTVIYDAIQAYNVWGAAVTANFNREKLLQDKIVAVNLELRKQGEALFRTAEQQKVFDTLAKAQLDPLSTEAKHIGEVTHQLTLMSDALQQAGSAGVNLDKMKEQIQSLLTASVITGTGGSSVDVNRHSLIINAIKQQMAVQREADAAEAAAVTPREHAAAARLKALADTIQLQDRDIANLKVEDAVTRSLTNADIELRKANEARALQQRQTVETQQLELQLVGKGIAEQTRLRTELQETQELKRRFAEEGKAYTQADIDKAREYAKALGDLAQASAVASLKIQTDFETQTVFLSDSAQKVAAVMLNIYGDRWQQHMNDAVTLQMRFNEVMKEAEGITRDFAGTFVDDIMAGKKATDALTDAFGNLEKRLISMALDAVIQGLFKMLVGGLTGGGGLSGLLGIGSTSTKSGGLFHQGGYVGSTPVPRLRAGLAYDEFPAILHVGERVIPAGGGQPQMALISGEKMTRLLGGVPRFEGGFNAAAAAAGAYTAGNTGSSGSWNTVSGGGGNATLSAGLASQYGGASAFGGTSLGSGHSSNVGGGSIVPRVAPRVAVPRVAAPVKKVWVPSVVRTVPNKAPVVKPADPAVDYNPDLESKFGFADLAALQTTPDPDAWKKATEVVTPGHWVTPPVSRFGSTDYFPETSQSSASYTTGVEGRTGQAYTYPAGSIGGVVPSIIRGWSNIGDAVSNWILGSGTPSKSAVTMTKGSLASSFGTNINFPKTTASLGSIFQTKAYSGSGANNVIPDEGVSSWTRPIGGGGVPVRTISIPAAAAPTQQMAGSAAILGSGFSAPSFGYWSPTSTMRPLDAAGAAVPLPVLRPGGIVTAGLSGSPGVVGAPGKMLSLASFPTDGSHPNLKFVSAIMQDSIARGWADLLAIHPGYKLVVTEGYTSLGHAPRSQHRVPGLGAVDIQLYDPQNNPIPREGPLGTPGHRIYGPEADKSGMYALLASNTRREMAKNFPDQAGHLRWGGYFAASSRNPRADLMHFDMGAGRSARSKATARRYHQGGYVGSTPAPLRMVSFDGAPGLKSGLDYDESLAVLKEGERVISSGGAARVSTSVVVNIINNANADVSARTSTGDNGETRLDIMVDQMVAAKMRDGGSRISRTLAAMGTTPQPVRR